MSGKSIINPGDGLPARRRQMARRTSTRNGIYELNNLSRHVGCVADGQRAGRGRSFAVVEPRFIWEDQLAFLSLRLAEITLDFTFQDSTYAIRVIIRMSVLSQHYNPKA